MLDYVEKGFKSYTDSHALQILNSVVAVKKGVLPPHFVTTKKHRCLPMSTNISRVQISFEGVVAEQTDLEIIFGSVSEKYTSVAFDGQGTKIVDVVSKRMQEYLKSLETYVNDVKESKTLYASSQQMVIVYSYSYISGLSAIPCRIRAISLQNIIFISSTEHTTKPRYTSLSIYR
jgi:hypothetical protein